MLVNIDVKFYLTTGKNILDLWYNIQLIKLWINVNLVHLKFDIGSKIVRYLRLLFEFKMTQPDR